MAFARQIAPDSKTKIKNAHLATSEPDELAPSCSGELHHTVWFQISVPSFTTVLLNTNNSRLPNTPSINDTVIALYSVSNGFLTEVQCVDVVSYETLTAYMTATLDPNTTYYIQLGSPYIHSSGNWQYMLASRVLFAEHPLANDGFETALSNADWKVCVEKRETR